MLARGAWGSHIYSGDPTGGSQIAWSPGTLTFSRVMGGRTSGGSRDCYRRELPRVMGVGMSEENNTVGVSVSFEREPGRPWRYWPDSGGGESSETVFVLLTLDGGCLRVAVPAQAIRENASDGLHESFGGAIGLNLVY
ncbi:MAG: hypothetical protein AAFS10_12150, partial [Myxococcota bacterium]